MIPSSGWINLVEQFTQLKQTHLLTRLLIYYKVYESIDRGRVMMQKVKSFMMELLSFWTVGARRTSTVVCGSISVWKLPEERMKSCTFENFMETSLCSHD